MTRNRTFSSYAALAASLALGTFAGAAYAQNAVAPTVEAPAASVTQPAADTHNFLTLTEIESRLTAQGIRVTEIEVRDKVLDIEGHSAKEGKLDLIVDRRTGEILSRKRDD